MKITINEMYDMVEGHFDCGPDESFFNKTITYLLDEYSESEMADGEYVVFPDIEDYDYDGLFNFFSTRVNNIMDKNGIGEQLESIFRMIKESCEDTVRKDEEAVGLTKEEE